MSITSRRLRRHITKTATSTTLSGLPWESGLYAIQAKSATALEFANYRGAPVDMVIAYPSRDNGWTSMLNSWWLTARPTPETKVEVVIPLWPNTGSLEVAATGGYNAEWAQLVGMLNDGDIIRPGWEMNLQTTDWYWVVTPDNLALWRQAWTHAYDTIKATNPTIRVSFTGNIGENKSGVPIADVYVDGKADVIGVDCYDWWPAVVTESDWVQYRDQPAANEYGLTEWLAFAQSKGVKLALPEWGLRTAAQSGGGDNALYIQKIYEWMNEHRKDIMYENFFNVESWLGSPTSGTPCPNASLQYKASIQQSRL